MKAGDLVIYNATPKHPYPRHGRFVSILYERYIAEDNVELCEIPIGTMAMFIAIDPTSFTNDGLWLVVVLVGDRLVSTLNDVFTPYVASEESNEV